MHIQVQLFASLRERAGTQTVELELPSGARVSDALAAVQWITDGVSVVMAVNREYAVPTALLSEGDELALIPPVSGGATGVVLARVTTEPLSVDRLLEAVRDPRAGAVVSFSGVTREVPQLDYEAYLEMAERKLAEIAAAAVERHGLCSAAVEHKVGVVELSEPSVIVAVSAPHRAEAFAGAREIIDVLKEQAPIWKREEGEWVAGHVPRASE